MCYHERINIRTRRFNLSEGERMILKTLKDLSRPKDSVNSYRIVEEETLKQEAIKWVKFLKKDKGKDIEERASQMVWIMHFHNITEEDLK